MNNIIVFMTLIPDDYHGYPEIKEFVNDRFPLPPSRDVVYNHWKDAGYSWSGSGNPKDLFDEYGDLPCFYFTYILIVETSFSFKELKDTISYGLGMYFDDNDKNDEENVVDKLMNIAENTPEINNIITIPIPL